MEPSRPTDPKLPTTSALHAAPLFLGMEPSTLRDTLSQSIHGAGIQVKAFDSAAELRAACLLERPGLILLDCLIPGQCGFAWAARMRIDALAPCCPVLLLGRIEESQGQARAAHAGAQGYLSLHTSPQTILERVTALLAESTAIPQGHHLHASIPSGGAPALERSGELKENAAAPLPGIAQEGAWNPDQFANLLIALYRAGSSGTLEIQSGLARARVLLVDGRPAAVTLSPLDVNAATVLRELQVLGDQELKEAEAGARFDGAPLLQWLLREGFLDPSTVDLVAQELTIRRLIALKQQPDGRYTLWPASPYPQAARPIHPAVLLWRLWGLASPVQPIPASLHASFVTVENEVEQFWPLLDSGSRLGALRLLLLGGGRVQDLIEIGGNQALILVSLLVATGLCHLCEEAPDPTRRSSLLARLNLDPFRERLYAHFATIPDADPWTTLGLAPGADMLAIGSAASALVARYRPEALPPGLSLVDRACALSIYRQALRASRLLSHATLQERCAAAMSEPSAACCALPELEDRAVEQAERARELLRKGHAVGAAALLQLAILLEGEEPGMLAMLGLARHLAAPEDPYAGEKELRRSLQLDPTNPWSKEQLALILSAPRPTGTSGERGAQETDEARSLLHAVLLHHPGAESARRLLETLEGQGTLCTRSGSEPRRHQETRRP